MKIKIHNYENSTTRVIEYPGNILLFIKVHYLSWGFYNVIKTGKSAFSVTDVFTGELIEDISKA
jgi:hypothetical protein